MSRRRKIDYEMVFRAVYELVMSRAHVEYFVMDFEVAIWTALRELNAQRVLSPVPIKERGCQFHWCQALYRQIKSIDLETIFA